MGLHVLSGPRLSCCPRSFPISLAGHTDDHDGEGVEASGGGAGGATFLGLRGSSAPALARLSGAPAAGLSGLDRAPAKGLVARPGHPRRLTDRGRGIRQYVEDSTDGDENDAPEVKTPSPIEARRGGGGPCEEGGCRGNNPGAGGREPGRTDTGSVGATPPPPAREQGVNSRSKLPRDATVFDGSVQLMASSRREESSTELGAVVVAKASVFLTSPRKTSLHPAELRSVGRA